MRRLSLLCIVAAALTPLAAPGANAVETRVIDISQERWVEVTGEASVSATPDFARVTLGVTTTGKDAREAVAANAKAVNALIALIKGEGIAPADVQTSSLSISPQFSNPRSGGSAEQSIVGYSVSNMVTVTVRDVVAPRLADRQGGRGRRQCDVRHRLWRERSERAARQGETARGRRRQAEGGNLRQRRRRQGRTFDGTQRTGQLASPWCFRAPPTPSAPPRPRPRSRRAKTT